VEKGISPGNIFPAWPVSVAKVVMVAMVVAVITHWFAHDLSDDGA
jgi:hypothetical protein